MNISDVEFLTEEDVKVLKEFLSKEFTCVCIYAGDSVSSLRDRQIYYKVEGEHPYFDEPFLVEEYDELFTLCDCEVCSRRDKNLWEYYSIYLALKFVKVNLPLVPIIIRVDSDDFLADAVDGFYYPDRSKCQKINRFMSELFDLLWKLGIAGTENNSIFKNNY